LVAGIFGGAAAVGSYAIALVLELLGAPVTEQPEIVEIVERGRFVELAVLGIVAIAAAPATEEWLFRGMLFRRLTLGNGLVVAHTITALAFAAVHANPSGVLTYAWLSVCFASAYARTGRLWAAVVVHALNNGLTFALLVSGWP
jgi:membrane protease YdiL (CAAX protease family)